MPEFLRENLELMTDLIRTGGVVMVPLVILSLVMWLLIIERVFFFRRLYKKNMNSSTALCLVRENTLPDPKMYRGAVSLLVTEFIGNRSGSPQLDRHLLDAAVARINRRMTRSLAVIGVLAAMAPLMGLLGTVTGMISTFDVLAIFGTGNAKAMAGGISESLITTQTGLIVAIPGLYMKVFLDRRAEHLSWRIQRMGLYLKRHL
ncbi:MotA/TolQ/ExbB proton channel family protein [Desulfobacter postgatei]|jgi:biopolymer transport protein ExbB|uniref:MotA/TolQ/ExbB proton channel family protein n=1 Tax=Desulfobacter postgatei TaxID=2293 RepID=UPI002A36A7F6|nr:MotA/TolQ/ExbB proton channel family protein [Desulfobacter postgatei]MDX9963229.1 MotA/TolQ/ExbB proton channel family protein [Desulfobacter postgatei]